MTKRTKKAEARTPAERAEKKDASANLTQHQWKPGQSGNPGGRPAVIREVRDIARGHTATAMDTLVAIMTNSEAPPAARVAAAAHVLDRGYGKPVQNVNTTVRTIKQMTDDELIAYLSGADEANGGEGTADATRH